MANTDKEIKNLKISKEVHEILKVYCDKRGIKIYHFLEKLILEKCTGKKDIYGEDQINLLANIIVDSFVKFTFTISTLRLSFVLICNEVKSLP